MHARPVAAFVLATLLAFLCAMPLTAARAATPPAEVVAELPQARLIGQGGLTFLFFDVYDARLWAPAGFKAAEFEQVPLALELDYARALDGVKIAERSIEEMLRSGDIAADKKARWLAAMTQAFPDVKNGDRMTGVQVPGTATRFFINGRLSAEIRDAEFTRLFFGIWLSPRTSEPKLRKALLAGADRSN